MGYWLAWGKRDKTDEDWMDCKLWGEKIGIEDICGYTENSY